MCGIAGLIHRGKSSNVGSELQGMLQALKHRGEDSTGYALYGDTDGKNFIMRFKVGENVGEGSSSIVEDVSIYDGRKKIVDQYLSDMGAKIILCDPHRATVIGHNFKSSLKATTMSSPDIRAGISLLIAALSAKGESTIQNIEQIDRGYENIDARLKALGAKIQRV